MSPTISTTILFLNSIWDLISFLSICSRHLPCCRLLADAHLGLWTDELDRANPAAAAAMATLLLQWALVRLRGAASGPASDAACVDASATYVLEAAMVAVGVARGRMWRFSGWMVVVMSAVCWALVVRECVER
jgi:hypothetical protein